MKKEYKKPAIEMVMLDHTDIISTSNPGYSVKEVDTPTVTNSIWDR